MTKIDHAYRNDKERGLKGHDWRKEAEEAAAKLKVFTAEEREAYVREMLRDDEDG